MRVNPLPATLEIPQEVLTGNLAAHFEALVTLYGPKLACADGVRTLSFEQVNTAANRLAHALVSAGIALGEPVALLLHHNVSNVVAILGVIKAGGAYAALLPSDPHAWQETILHDLACRFLVADAATAPAGRAHCTAGRRLIVLDELEHMPTGNLERSIPSESPATIYYTSGSTGKPKGALRDHCSYLYRIWLEQQLFARGPADRTSVLNPYRFHAFVPSLFTNLFNGTSVHFFSLQEQGLHRLADWLLSERITMLQISSSALSTWLDMLPADAYFPALRSVRPTQRFLRKTLEQLWPHLSEESVVLHRMAGTETGVVTFNVLTRTTPLDSEIVPVGWPVPTVDLAIHDEAGEPLPAGATGEIVIRSRFLVRGYWNRPDETNRRFSVDPQDARYQIYRSGDLGRLRPDGQLELMGRKDLMLKIRGYRVEPGEVEYALLQHPAIKQAAVTGVPIAGDDKLLVAYLVARDGCSVDNDSLRAFLREQLPAHMIPSRLVTLAAMPVNAVGKVDWSRLPPVISVTDRRPEEDPPRTPLETIVAQVWCDILELEAVGVHEDFFDLGGQSLLAGRIVGRVIDQLGIELSPAILLEAPTVAAMSYAVLEHGVAQLALDD